MAVPVVGEWVREPAVAGTFYTDDPVRLRGVVQRHLGGGERDETDPPPAALIAPHAGYRYSGPTAGAGWATLAAAKTTPDRIVLIGPSHRVPVGGSGVGVSSAAAWRTPLGDVPLDRAGADALVDDGLAVVADDAHAPEHSLEVHLPFLLEALGPVPVIPLVTGRCPAEAAAAALRRLWDDEGTVVVVSSDLSHYLPEPEARARDERTLAAIVEGRVDDIGPEDACGRIAVGGLLHRGALARDRPVARRRGHVRRHGGRRRPRGRLRQRRLHDAHTAHGRRAGLAGRRGRAPRSVHEVGTGEPDPLDDDRGPGPPAPAGRVVRDPATGGASDRVHRLARGRPAAVVRRRAQRPGRGVRGPALRAARLRGPGRPRRQGVGPVGHRAPAG